jgi:hypothetical protein
MILIKKVLAVITLVIVSVNVGATPVNKYVAYSTGINMRKSASLKAELVGKIPYSTLLRVEVSNTDTATVIVEGMIGHWTPVIYQNKKGYVLDCYLTSIVPPKKGTATMFDYFKQLTVPFGTPLKIKSGSQMHITENGYEIKKQLYKNGISWHQYRSYEYAADSYFIPGVSIQEAFLIIRHIKEFDRAYTEKDEFPTLSKKYTKKVGDYESAYDVKVDAENWNSTTKYVKSISLSFEEGAYSNLFITILDTGEACITYSSGV